MNFRLPTYVENILNKLEIAGFQGYIVGGSVRDLLLGRQPSDFDITTDALPEDILEVFNKYKRVEIGKKFGTIALVQAEGIIEITTFRFDGEYIDGRRPIDVKFSTSLKEDLSRRDFTINAMAYNNKVGLIDYFNGINDLKEKMIKTVGKPEKRFKEDYLRIMRAIRFASQLGFNIDLRTYEECKENIQYISCISIERIRDEFFKILLSKKPSYGVRMLKEIKALEIILPEITKSIGFDQHNPNHDKDVFEHTLCVLDNTPTILELRLGALLHDIGKPLTFTLDEDSIGHFYGHDKLGVEMANIILQRWKAPNDLIKKVTILIDKHMTVHDGMKEKGLKRLISKVGEDNIFKLLELQKADRFCSREGLIIEDLLEREHKVIEILKNKEVYEKNQLAINGRDMIELGYKQGKIIGDILDYLLEQVLENPSLNSKEKLVQLIKENF